MKYTTLEEIRKHTPRKDGWRELTETLGRKTGKVSFKKILESNGVKDAVWCLRVLSFDDQRQFRADVSELVLHLFESKYPDDRPRKAIEATRNEFDLDKLKEASYAAAFAAYAAADYDAYIAAAYAAEAADATAYADAAAYAAKKWQEIEQIFIKHYC